MLQWWLAHGWIWTLISIAAFVAGLVALPALAVRLPEDYLVSDQYSGKRRVGWLRSMVKNVAGGLLVAMGVLMSLPLVPGPGILAIVIGLSLMSFPGKRKLEHKLVGNAWVLNLINRLRRRRGRPAIMAPHSRPLRAQ